MLGILVDFVYMIIEGFFFLALIWFSFDKWFTLTTLYWCLTCFLLVVTALIHSLIESGRGSRGYIWPELGLFFLYHILKLVLLVVDGCPFFKPIFSTSHLILLVVVGELGKVLIIVVYNILCLEIFFLSIPFFLFRLLKQVLHWIFFRLEYYG